MTAHELVKEKSCCIVLLLMYGLGAFAQGTATAFVDVKVVPMDSPRVLAHQTVLIEHGRITRITPARSTKLHNGVQRIDGKNRYLVPGLADMHVHFIRPAIAGQFQPSASADYERENRILALLYVANGVTTVRNMWGHPAIDALKDSILRGEIIGPYIYSTGPITDGTPVVWASSRAVTTQAEAEQAVKADREHGYVGIKVYNNLSANAYRFIVDAAAKEGISVVGHVPTSVGLDGAIQAHQYSVEHLHGFAQAALRQNQSAAGLSDATASTRADPSKLPQLAV